jgi:HD-GYP domain-containing protein (c-di-GMP phosphodiesterase class II)/HAMP domain-containing protein
VGDVVRSSALSEQYWGLTLAWASPDFPDRVLGADVTLDTLAAQLRKQRLTPGHRLALVNAKEELMAADEPGAKLSEFSARTGWQSSRIPVGLGLTLWSQVPEAELQEGARAAITRSLLITLALLALTLPLTLWLARRITRSLQRLSEQARAIKRFEFEAQPPVRSHISEVAELDEAMGSMRRSIQRFVEVTGVLAEETDFERLQLQLLKHTLPAVDAQAGVLYLMEDDALLARSAWRQDGEALDLALPPLGNSPVALVAQALRNDETLGGRLSPDDLVALGLMEPAQHLQLSGAIVVPLHNRKRERIGALLLLCEGEPLPSRVRFAQALASSAATAIETRELIQAQRALFESFIQLIAAAIDAKSPYTGGHCARVPNLTKALAKAACDAQTGPFASFQLSAEEWEALHVGAWLHDCGKVTTPDSVVDKATKLETIYNRIHELRMRFELLKRDAEIAHLRRVLEGSEPEASAKQRDAEQASLDEEFAFVAHCNIGGERMEEGDVQRLQQIAERRWLRTLDDRLGLSNEERDRLRGTPAATLPCWEPLIADKPEHAIPRTSLDPALQPNNPWGFQQHVPELLYQRGELYNLSVSRGTLSSEERFKINEHIVQTIVMLSKLPYPRHLRSVPEIAGGHHEKMDGTGYPKRLKKHEMSLPARMMAIADIFEALTAADRPYKDAKPLSEALSIMAHMAATDHIDTDLFELFVRSGVALNYAQANMAPQHVDAVDLDALFQRSVTP